jgi:hypothetical protein
MTDELPQSKPESQQGNSPVLPTAVSPHPSKSNKKLWILLGVAISILCCISIICIAVIEPLLFNASMMGVDKASTEMAIEKAPIESIIDSYMEYMAAKDAERAYALISPRAQQEIKISKIQELLKNNYVLFEGYQSLSIYSVNVGAFVNINPNARQGIITSVSGIITYENDIQRTFSGTVEKVNGEWQIADVYITLPPIKKK